MKTACFIPIKKNSERIKNKNLILLNGKKLYRYICEHSLEARVFDEIYIDTDSEEIISYAEKMNFKTIERKPELSLNSANGNDLLFHHFELFSHYDYYFQLFATAPYLQPATIRDCFETLIGNEKFDSCFTATEHYGFYWLNNNPINYRPGILPRSQDLTPLLEETTGLYGISRESLQKYRCRIGKNPYIKKVDKFEAVDINVPEDVKFAEFVGRTVYGYVTEK